MGDYRTYSQSFTGGIMTPEFFGQIADGKYQTGLAVCKNWVVLPHGPIANRPGTRFVREVKDSSKSVRLLSFYFTIDQTLVIEFGEGYFRFHTMGQTVLQGTPSAWDGATDYVIGDIIEEAGTNYYAIADSTNETPPNATYWYAQPADGAYEVPHTYTEGQLDAVQYVQSGDVVTLAHPDHPPRELRRNGATNWVVEDIVFGSTLDAPTSVTGVGTAGDTPGTAFDTEYVVTATATDIKGEESLQSETVTVSNNLYDDGAYNTISWTPGASSSDRYYVYKRSTGIFGYIGQTDELTFKDENIAPDIGLTPPLDIDLFEAADNYPRTVGYADQRRGFASTTTQPQNIWLSKSATETNFDYSVPNKDSDSLQFKIAARGGDAILHMVPMDDIILTTAAGIWRISSGSDDVLLPNNFSARKTVQIGAADVTPVVVGNMLYVAAAGGHIREFGFSGDRGGYTSGDISIRAPHLFDDHNVTRLSHQQSPFPIVWATSTSGALIGLTYVPEQSVGAWHTHETLGTFEDVATVTEDKKSVTYFVIQRSIDGVDVRYIEYLDPLHTRNVVDQADQYFVDCGATYDGVATSTITGLDWLEGETVAILADGAVLPPRVVANGEVTLDEDAAVVHVGLPYECDMQSLPLAIAANTIPAYAQGLQKNINQAFLKVYRTSGILAGPSFDDLVEHKQRTIEPMGSPPDLKSETLDIVVQPSWGDDGQIAVRHKDPTAAMIMGMTLDVAVSGD